jgi:hypothetical protein
MSPVYQAHSHRTPQITRGEALPPAELALALGLVVLPVLLLLISLLISL